MAEDREAVLGSYEEKVLEPSGTVGDLVRPGGLNPTLGVVFESIDDRLAFDSGLNFVFFETDDADAVEEFNGLSVGDRVTLHCRLERLSTSGTRCDM